MNRSSVGKRILWVLVALFGMIAVCVAKAVICDLVGIHPDSLAINAAMFWILPLVISTAVGVAKGRAVFGFILGALVSWVGVMVIAGFSNRKTLNREGA